MGCAVAGAGVCAGEGMGVVILRGGIATPAVSSAGPATSGAGAGVSPGGNEKSCTLCCAASGAANSVSENMYAKRCRTGFMAAKQVKRHLR